MSEELKVGMVLGRDLAWERKYLVTHITKVAGNNSKYDNFVVCLRYLGQYYADGRSKPSVKLPERELLTWDYCGNNILTPTDVRGYRLDRKWDGSRLKN